MSKMCVPGPWTGIRWIALGLLMALVALTSFLAAMRPLNLWLHANFYREGELEIVRFQPVPGEGGQGRFIEGVIHPGSESVQTSDTDLAIRHFVDPNDTTGRLVPLPGEIEGRHMLVWYWPNHSAMRRWWHPPAVVMPGATQQGWLAVVEVIFGSVALGLGIFCFQRGAGILKETLPD